ncbi:MAG: HYExAFE family protein [Planctomycetota bacterium]
MGRRQTHYEHAFRAFLIERGVPFVAVDEARRALLGSDAAVLKTQLGSDKPRTLKAFDFLLYGTPNLLVELKGRKLAAGSTRLENWVTDDDVDSLRRWQRLFGDGYVGAFAFVYRCEGEPPAPLFEQAWIHRDRWYAMRAVGVDAYAERMRVRSAKWRTVSLASKSFDEISGPLIATAGSPG